MRESEFPRKSSLKPLGLDGLISWAQNDLELVAENLYNSSSQSLASLKFEVCYYYRNQFLTQIYLSRLKISWII